MVSIAVAGADTLARTGVRVLLESQRGFKVVADTPDAERVPEVASEARARVVVLMLSPATYPITRFVDRARGVAVVLVGTPVTPVEVREALRAGACAYILREHADVELVAAVRSAANGARYVSPSLGATLLAARDGNSRNPGLTERQCDILRFLALGHTNVEIARILSISTRTVEAHRAHLQRRLGLSTRAELVCEARGRRLLEADFSPEAA